MSTESSTPQGVVTFLQKNFPQISMHGGSVEQIDYHPETEMLDIELGGMCHGCGLSGMTSVAIQNRLTDQFDSVSAVEVTTVES